MENVAIVPPCPHWSGQRLVIWKHFCSDIPSNVATVLCEDKSSREDSIIILLYPKEQLLALGR